MAVDLDDGGVDHGVFHIRLVRTGLEKPDEDIGFDPIPESLEHGVPVAERRWKITPWAARAHDPQHRFDKKRLSPPLRPGSLGFPRQWGSIFDHWASVKTNRSIRSLNHEQAQVGILNLNRP